jgi:hypothetical protein
VPLIKLEGAVGCWPSPSFVLNLLPRRWRWMLVAVVGGLALALPSAGSVAGDRLWAGAHGWAKVDIPLLGTLVFTGARSGAKCCRSCSPAELAFALVRSAL